VGEHEATTDVVYAKSRVLLVDQYDHVLLMLTRHDVEGYPARWLTTGGHLEPGEDHRQAAIRELFEETGLRIDDPENWTPEERVDILDSRWWSLRELERTTDVLEPTRLAQLMRGQLSSC
jgi:8-oxo-dGTP pyrophosphatase MutT (NUDIX family)